MLHEPPGTTVLQSFVSANELAFVPVTLTLEIDRVAEPPFDMDMMVGVPVIPTCWLAKDTVIGFASSDGDWFLPLHAVTVQSTAANIAWVGRETGPIHELVRHALHFPMREEDLWRLDGLR